MTWTHLLAVDHEPWAVEQAWRDGCQWRALGLHPWWDDDNWEDD